MPASKVRGSELDLRYHKKKKKKQGELELIVLLVQCLLMSQDPPVAEPRPVCTQRQEVSMEGTSYFLAP
jgi:hypothetical protein